MVFSVGSDVESMCNTCGDVWHVIVAKIGEKITKVQCKQCAKQHRFRPTGAAPEANLNPTRTRVPSPTSSTGKRKKPGRAGVLTTIEHDPSKPSRPYVMSERFAKGEQIQHDKFGPGVVCGVEDNKIRVNFSQGLKVLRHSRH